MVYFFSSYWWLLFPIGFFVFGAWDRWLAYKRSRDHLDLLKHYAQQGKDPPPELVRNVSDDMPGEAPGGYPPGYGYGGYWWPPSAPLLLGQPAPIAELLPLWALLAVAQRLRDGCGRGRLLGGLGVVRLAGHL